jgi:hypothetical protein
VRGSRPTEEEGGRGSGSPKEGKNGGDDFDFGEERARRRWSWIGGHEGRGGLPHEGFRRRMCGERKVHAMAVTCFRAV